MKLTTLNTQGFTNWKERQSFIAEYISAEKPDVVFFQEVVFLPDTAPFNQVQLLNKEINYPYELSSVTRLQDSTVYKVYREGLATISRYPIVKSDTIVLQQAEGDEHNRIVQLLDIQIGDEIVKFANIHFSLTDFVDYATAHLVELFEILAARGEQRIITGDFNITHLENFEYIWGDAYTASTQVPYVSFPGEDKRVDYYLIPKAYSFASITTSDDSLSDHRAVTVELS